MTPTTTPPQHLELPTADGVVMFCMFEGGEHRMVGLIRSWNIRLTPFDFMRQGEVCRAWLALREWRRQN